MKKFMSILFAGVAVIALSGCGGGGSSDSEIYSVDILDLRTGYIVTGINDINDVVELVFCGNNYDEYINYSSTTTDFGTFVVDDKYIDFSSSLFNNYYIDTTPTDYNLLVGDIYDIYITNNDYIDSLEITSIELIDCI